MEGLLGTYAIRYGQERTLTLGDNKLVIGMAYDAFSYKRYEGDKLQAESMVLAGLGEATIGIFPCPPLLTPSQVAENVYLKFRSPVVLEQKSETVLYTKIPVEIGVYEQSEDEEILLDAFSLAKQRYALYGPPETGIVCRFAETELTTKEDAVEVKRYEEAAASIHIRNMTDNVVKVSKVIIPMQDVVLDHLNDDTSLPGSVEMTIERSFGKDVVNVKLAETSVKRRDKTSRAKREETLALQMDAGY